MLIGVHAKALSEKNPTGVAEYASQVLQRLVMLPEARGHRFCFYTDAAAHVAPGAACVYKILRSPLLWTQGRLAWELFLHEPDVLFVPQHVLPRTASGHSVVTIHGLEFERFPQYYSWQERKYLSWVTRDAAKRASRIIAVSHVTKLDLMEFYGVSEEKITVVYHGAPEVMEHGTRNMEQNTKYMFQVSGFKFQGQPYFLYIGRMEKKKNVDGVIRAFAIAKERYKLPHELVLAGGDGYGSEEIKRQIANAKYRDEIRLLGYVSDAVKWDLLRNAEAFVFPSWYEGFGLPILEAQAAGIPVITSNVSAMPEIAGVSASGTHSNNYHHTLVHDGSCGAICVDPADPESIAEAMRIVAEDKVLRDALVAKGRENLKRFSWDACARETFLELTRR